MSPAGRTLALDESPAHYTGGNHVITLSRQTVLHAKARTPTLESFPPQSAPLARRNPLVLAEAECGAAGDPGGRHRGNVSCWFRRDEHRLSSDAQAERDVVSDWQCARQGADRD